VQGHEKVTMLSVETPGPLTIGTPLAWTTLFGGEDGWGGRRHAHRPGLLAVMQKEFV